MATPLVAVLRLSLAAAFAVCCGYSDARSGRIPNRWTVPAFLAALLVWVGEAGPRGLACGALGALVCGAIPLLLYWCTGGAGIGGGDVKLFVSLGAWLGPELGLRVELAAFMALGVQALALVLWRWRARRAGSAAVLAEELRLSLRCGPAIAVCTVGAVVFG